MRQLIRIIVDGQTSGILDQRNIFPGLLVSSASVRTLPDNKAMTRVVAFASR
ncbi:hypothetical protein CCM_00263 [Cordyceps militaris CM01]|uniref:Uncharacterized protein n=1 Tax=Cordyceps militaris (strain CM01) TaxID=983644 RepID=G3J326_CORMM|nr:uncharacterized protein CCM_00263 [Cordyceps militaris CM01]EGX95609.1 hypothetical protein CCM_00263 [Cordyceps militaris CM01]